jgi:predicted ester cyclase
LRALHSRAEDDEVVARCTARGTHSGSMTGEEPTRNEIEISGFGSWRMEGGKVAEHWGVIDLMRLLQRIAVLRLEAAAGANSG